MDSTLDIRYQIVLLDPGATGRASTLRRALEKEFRELGLDPAESVVFLDAASFESRDPKAPADPVQRSSGLAGGGHGQGGPCSHITQ